jgi:hypothetical protein
VVCKYGAADTVRWQQQESSARYQQAVLMIEGVQLLEDDDVGGRQSAVSSLVSTK